jgi:hypothetical protein
MEVIIMVLMLIMVPAAFLIGRWKDIFWSVRMERTIMKKESLILSLLSKDRQHARYYKITPDSGVFIHKGKIWFADKKEICRATINEEISKIVDLKKVQNISIKDGDKIVIQEKKEMGGKKRIIPFSALTFETEKGLIIKEKNITYHEGVPIIFVDEDYLTPVPFGEVKGDTKPNDLFPWLANYISIQREKDNLSQKKDLDLVGVITLVLVVVSLILGYINYEGNNANALSINEMKGTVCMGTYQVPGSSNTNVPVPEGGSVQGNKIVVN